MNKMWENLKNYIQDVKSGEKKISKDGMLILFFGGLLLYVIFLPIHNNSSYEKEIAENQEQQSVAYKVEEKEEIEYKEVLEEELAEFLSSVEGIGEVDVLIYLGSSEEYIVEKDNPKYQVTSKQADNQSSEEKIEEGTVYTVNSVGEQVPFIAKTNSPTITGVVISAEGANQEEIRIKIIRTVMALYGVEANKIDVLERKK